MSDTTFMGVPRDKIDWCPRIDYDKCSDCMECVEFCPHNVFEIREDETPKLVIKNPANCVVFCRACDKTCGPDAIAFPDKNETVAHIKKIRDSEPESAEAIQAESENKEESFFPGQLSYETFQKDKYIFRLPTDEGFYFNENDVWAYVSGKFARVGVTDFVQKSLSDILFFTPPEVGAEITQFDEMGEIEAAKAVFGIVSPVSGRVTSVNENLTESPEMLNQNPYEQGWIAEIELSDFEEDLDLLHTFSGYLPVMKKKAEEFHV